MALWHAIAFLPYREYLQHKLQWTDCNAKNVHWEVLTSLLSSFHQDYQCCLVLLINKLPPWAAPTHPHHSSPLCPLCQCKPEDTWHFLECTHPKCNALFQTLHRNLTHMTQQLSLHPCILTALWLCLVTIRTDAMYPDIIPDVLPLVQAAHPHPDMTWMGSNQPRMDITRMGQSHQ